MKHEIITLQDVQIIGMSKNIEFCHPEECTKFWGEYVERIIKPVFMEGKTPDEFQQAAIDNGVGAFGLCTCPQVPEPYEFYKREGFKEYKSEEVAHGLTWVYMEKVESEK